MILATAYMLSSIFIHDNVFAAIGDAPGDVYWVTFKDKDSEMPISISERALTRRSLRSSSRDFTWYDAPVRAGYVADLGKKGIQIRNTSRWLNAVSAIIDDSLIDEIMRLPYVVGISRVSSYSRPRPLPAGEMFRRPQKISAFDDGSSFTQINMITVDSLHNLGLSGNGILIGITDTGFDTSHVVFSHLRSNDRIIATYDFMDRDSNVVDEPDIQRSHGTQVLSAIGGFSEGSLIGPAFDASFVLAKTESVYTEIRAEEDNWIAAAEWMESLGVDIISSSLGYIDWYDTTQLDGHTAAITLAANVANSLGVIVVNAAGNEGDTYWRKIIPPADGDSVIAVGAVDNNGEIAPFSSRGPTADGRIKPDFCAPGTSVFLANWSGGFGFAGGTSFATPLVAGGIALLLEGHRDWNLHDILGAMKTASSHSYLPNNTYGWGVPDFAAAYYNQMGHISGAGQAILIAPHPAVDSVVFYLALAANGSGELTIHDLSGGLVNRFSINNGMSGINRFVWDGKNSGGREVTSGIYICLLATSGREATEKFFYISNR